MILDVVSTIVLPEEEAVWDANSHLSRKIPSLLLLHRFSHFSSKFEYPHVVEHVGSTIPADWFMLWAAVKNGAMVHARSSTHRTTVSKENLSFAFTFTLIDKPFAGTTSFLSQLYISLDLTHVPKPLRWVDVSAAVYANPFGALFS